MSNSREVKNKQKPESITLPISDALATRLFVKRGVYEKVNLSYGNLPHRVKMKANERIDISGLKEPDTTAWDFWVNIAYDVNREFKKHLHFRKALAFINTQGVHGLSYIPIYELAKSQFNHGVIFHNYDTSHEYAAVLYGKWDHLGPRIVVDFKSYANKDTIAIAKALLGKIKELDERIESWNNRNPRKFGRALNAITHKSKGGQRSRVVRNQTKRQRHPEKY